MAFLKYTDIPIFANFIDEFNLPNLSSAAQMFAATDATINFDTQMSVNRFLANRKPSMIPSGPLEGKISFSFYPMIETSNNNQKLNTQKQNQLNFFNLTGDFSQGHNINISNFLFKKTYLQNYSIKINPYQPVVVTANMISYDITNIEGSTLSSFGKVFEISNNADQPRYESLHGLTTSMISLDPNVLPDVKMSIDLNVDCQRTPIYTIGSKTPDGVMLNTVERTISIQGENINSVIDFNGKDVSSLKIFFLPLSSLGQTANNETVKNTLSFEINGKVTSQQLSVSQNSPLNGKIVIKEPIF
jgi:hypothetical protein